MKHHSVEIETTVADLAEDKDYARDLRLETILPLLEKGESVVLDFGKVKYVTQSFVHALIGEALKKYGEKVLDKFEFKNCSEQIKSIIGLVVDYSLGGFAVDETAKKDQQA